MNLALFDFDGTITSCETFPPFVRAVTPPLRLRLGGLLLAPLIVGYRLGWVSGTLVRRAIVRVAFTGLPAAAFDAAAARFAADYLPDVVRPVAMARIAWHRARGDTVVVVSGAFADYLQPWCEQHGLELICSALERNAGRLSGRYAGAQCVLAEKVHRIRERYDPAAFDHVYAYGDTVEDEPMLALAQSRWYRWAQVAP